MGELHSKFPPSSLDRLIRCPGSHKEREERPEQPQSVYAAHGSLLHEYVVKVYTEGKHIVRELEANKDRVAVLECIDYLETVVFPMNDPVIKLEEKMFVNGKNSEDPLLKEVWGTSDVVIYNSEAQSLDVIDWKFGKGVQVFARRNPQGMAYLCGGLIDYEDVQKFTFHVFQPFLDHIDTYECNREELEDFVMNHLYPALKDATSESPTYAPSVHACRFCIAKTDCPARHNFNTLQAREVFKMHAKYPKLTPQEIAAFLNNADELIEYINALKSFIRSEMLEGNKYEGWKLVYGRSNRTWSKEKEAVNWLLENTNLSNIDIFNTKLKGPAAIEKLDKTLKNDPDFQELIIKPEGKISIAKEKDKREEVTPTTQATQTFANYKA